MFVKACRELIELPGGWGSQPEGCLGHMARLSQGHPPPSCTETRSLHCCPQPDASMSFCQKKQLPLYVAVFQIRIQHEGIRLAETKVHCCFLATREVGKQVSGFCLRPSVWHRREFKWKEAFRRCWVAPWDPSSHATHPSSLGFHSHLFQEASPCELGKPHSGPISSEALCSQCPFYFNSMARGCPWFNLTMSPPFHLYL